MPELTDCARNAWYGRLPLWFTYWVLGVGGNMSFLGLLVAMWALGEFAVLTPLRIVYCLSLLWFVFIFVAIWRAARQYRGRALWATLARAGVLVGIVRMSAEAYVLLRPEIIAG